MQCPAKMDFFPQFSSLWYVCMYDYAQSLENYREEPSPAALIWSTYLSAYSSTVGTRYLILLLAKRFQNAAAEI